MAATTSSSSALICVAVLRSTELFFIKVSLNGGVCCVCGVSCGLRIDLRLQRGIVSGRSCSDTTQVVVSAERR